MASMNRRLPLALLLPVLALGACSQVENAVSDAATDAGTQVGCQLAQPAIDQGRSFVDQVVQSIDADPAAAQQQLTAAGQALQLAAPTLTGEIRNLVDQASAAVENLRGQAEAAAAGTTVDDQVVQAAQDEYAAAAEQLTGIC